MLGKKYKVFVASICLSNQFPSHQCFETFVMLPDVVIIGEQVGTSDRNLLWGTVRCQSLLCGQSWPCQVSDPSLQDLTHLFYRSTDFQQALILTAEGTITAEYIVDIQEAANNTHPWEKRKAPLQWHHLSQRQNEHKFPATLTGTQGPSALQLG